MKCAIQILLGAAATTVILIGCGTARRDTPLMSQPRDISDPKLALGKRVFDNNCYQCHPGGDKGLAPGINDKPVPAWLMKTQIRAGLGAMPSFSKKELSDKEVDAVAAYLLYLRSQKVEVVRR